MNEAKFTVYGVFMMFVHAVNPEAAAGAVVGGLFFWALSPSVDLATRFWLLLASVGLGYGVGLPAARSAEWSSWTWIFACLGASLAHVVIVAVQAMVSSSSDFPPWMKSLFNLLPWRRTRGEE